MRATPENTLDLRAIGQRNLRSIHRNLPSPVLYETIIRHREGQVCHLGPLVVRSGDFAELPLEDKYIVDGAADAENAAWGERYQRMGEDRFQHLANRLIAYMQNRDVYVQYCHVGQDPTHRVAVRFVTETAWHNLFVRNLFQPIEDRDLATFEPDFSVVHIPGFRALPELDGTRSSAFLLVNVPQRVIAICGTSYAGEIRQAVFTLVNALLPTSSVFCLRCSANMGPDGDVAIFLGRGGTGKTALAVDAQRRFVGDHVHGWTDAGLFSFERGAYARCVHLSPEEQPEIHACTRTFGSILENVSVDPETRRIAMDDTCLTENTRVAFPLTHLPNGLRRGICGHPRHLFLLTCDAFGVFPPLARLEPETAVYAFLSGYTSRISRTEAGVLEPDIHFDSCFGMSTLTLPAETYGSLLLERILRHGVTCWLLNTGWTGEPEGRGPRIPIAHTRALVRAVVAGQLDGVGFDVDPLFQFRIPRACPGVPAEILNPRTSAQDTGEYELRANQLAREFVSAFAAFEGKMPESLRATLSGVLSLDDQFDLLDELNFSL